MPLKKKKPSAPESMEVEKEHVASSSSGDDSDSDEAAAAYSGNEVCLRLFCLLLKSTSSKLPQSRIF